MKSWKSVALVAVLLVTATTSQAGHYGRRQYYSGWSSGYGYHYRTYYYQPYVSYPSYNYHYVVYYPSQPYYYYYNPYTQVYWGRSPIKNDGKAVYSILDPKHRKGTLAEIKEEDFPKPGPMPNVPESKDEVKIDIPPGDLPTGQTLPKAG